MVIQLSCLGRAQPADLDRVLPAITQAVGELDVDHSRLAVVLDWVQYRRNFRAPVMVRPFGRRPGTAPGSQPLAEIAIDVRRASELDEQVLAADIRDRLAKALGLVPDVHECIHLEEWVRPSKSVIWSFNRSYWRHLAAWDETFSSDYASALPGGVSDGTNPAFWTEQIACFLRTLDRLDEWSELPEEIDVIEFGVGDGQQARVWLDTFAQACSELGRDYFDRLSYLMADYSPHVLTRARERVSAHGSHVRSIELDFRNPIHGLSHLRGRVLFAHTCNLYDNLPTDEIIRVGDHAYEPLVRASITPPEAADLSARFAIAEERLVPAVQAVLREGPDAFGSQERGVEFWSDVWDAVHLEEIYEQIPAPATLRVAPSCELHLDELLDELPEWTRAHTSTVALESFAQTLALLHYEGVLVAQDLFVRGTDQYTSFRGPGKLEGSIVNWLNGPLFQLVGERSGFSVAVEPFAYREKSNTVVLSARHRDAHRPTPLALVAEPAVV